MKLTFLGERTINLDKISNYYRKKNTNDRLRDERNRKDRKVKCGFQF